VLRPFPAQRPRGLSLSGARAPCSPAQRRLRAALPLCTRADFRRAQGGARAPTGSEPVDANEARGIRVSRRDHPLRRPASIGPAAFSSARRLERPASDTPVASSPVVIVDRDAIRTSPREGRRDRFRARLVKGSRFRDPRCLPSASTACTLHAPKHVRVTRPSSIARRSRDEDRRAPTNRSPFRRARRPGALAPGLSVRAQAPVHARRAPRGLSTRDDGDSRFSGPGDGSPISATRRRTRHRLRARGSSIAAKDMTYLRCVRLLPLSAFADSDAKRRAATATRLRRSVRARTGPTRAKAHATLVRASPLLEPGRTPPCRARARVRGRTPPRILPAHRATHRTRACDAPPAGLRSRIAPRREVRSREDRGAFRPRASVRCARIAPRAPSGRASRLRGVRRPREEDRRVATRRTCASLTARS